MSVNRASRQSQHGVLRRGVLLVLALVCALAVTGCGATVDTVLTIDAAGKGTRTMTATARTSAIAEHVKGGVKAVETSIRKRLPEGVTYHGRAAKGDSTVFTLTLSFGSLEDYRRKVALLVSKGTGKPFLPRIDLDAPDTIFRHGVSLSENFTSADLLGWIGHGMADDGIIDRGNLSNLFESGTATVVFGGRSVATTNPVDLDAITDDGVSRVVMQTELRDDGTAVRTIAVALNARSYAANRAKFDAWFAEAAGSEATVEKKAGADGTTEWWVAIDGPADRIAAVTARVLGVKSSAFGVTEEVVDDGGPAVVRSVTSSTTCGICARTGGTEAAVVDEVVMTPGWQPVSGAAISDHTVRDRVVFSVVGGSTPATFRLPIPFQQVRATTRLGADHSIEQDIVYVVSAADRVRAGRQLTTMLAPAPEFGSLETREAGGTVEYVVRLRSPDWKGYNLMVERYLPGTLIAVDEVSGGPLRVESQVSVLLDLSRVGYGGVVGHTIEAPWLQQVDGGGAAASTLTRQVASGDRIVARVTGWTVGSFVMSVSLLGLGVAAVGTVSVLWVRRRGRTDVVRAS